jgi:hypothetical protein
MLTGGLIHRHFIWGLVSACEDASDHTELRFGPWKSVLRQCLGKLVREQMS